MFAAAQLERVAQVLQDMERPVALQLFLGVDPEDRLGRALGRAVGQICQAAGEQLCLIEEEADRSGRPLLMVENVRYRAVPLGPELDPFLDLLVALSRRPPGFSATTRTEEPRADAVEPAEVRVLMAPTCPVCPQVVRAAGLVAARHPGVQVEVVDVQYYREEAGGVEAVPAVVIDGERTIVGPLDEPRLLALLRDRASQGYEVESLASMVRSGRMGDAAAALSRPAGQRSLCLLFSQGGMQERIGLMLAVDEALARDRHALDGAVACLLPLLNRPDPVLRGDVADLLGHIGSPAARASLERLTEDADPDVREVAQESLAALRRPS